MLPTVMVPPYSICFTSKPGWNRFPINMTAIIRMLLLECLHQRRHGKIIIAADIQHQLGVGQVAVEVGEHVHFRHGEFESAIGRVIVRPMLPRREHVLEIARCLGLAVPRRVFGARASDADGAKCGAEHYAAKQIMHGQPPHFA
jgi:hypothetical protein